MGTNTIDLSPGKRFFFKREGDFENAMTYERVGIVEVALNDSTLGQTEFIYSDIYSSVLRGDIGDVKGNITLEDKSDLYSKIKADQIIYSDAASMMSKYVQKEDLEDWEKIALLKHARDVQIFNRRKDLGQKMLALLKWDEQDMKKTIVMGPAIDNLSTGSNTAETIDE